MKRILSISIAVFLLVVMAIPSLAQGRRRITIWCTDKEVAGIDPVRRKFQTDKRGTTVNIEIQAEPRSKYISAAKAGTAPDILVGAHDWVGELAKNGVIAEINLTPAQRARFEPLAIRGYTYNNRIYGVPYNFEALVIFYNTRLIKAVPKTWEELLTVAKGMTRGGEFGFLYGINNDFHRNFPFFGSQGAYIFKEAADGRYDITDVGLDSPGGIAAGEFIYRLVREGIVPSSTNNGTVESTFLDGKVAMVMDGCWNYLSYERALGKGNVGVAQLPTLNGRPSRSFIGARGFMINNASRSMDTAREFVVDYIGDKQGQIDMFNAGGRPPAHLEASRDVARANPLVQVMVDSARAGVLMPNVRAMAVVWNYAGGMIDRFNTGETSVENSIRTASNTIREEIGRNVARFE